MNEVVTNLGILVGCDTRNPPREFDAASAVFDFLRARLGGFDITQWDHGHGSVTLLATRGAPTSAFNFHLDTVPVAEGWRRDPFALHVDADKATGLGACDIKGALAAMLAACHETTGDVAVLVTSDEEAGSAACVREFLKTKPDYNNVFVAEPTRCRAVASHRGILSGSAVFAGLTGHASGAEALTGNAIHRAMRWGNACLVAIADDSQSPLYGVRFNAGRIEGGVKPNMIAASATVAFNVRTAPAQDQNAVIDALKALAGDGHVADWLLRFRAPALPDAARGEAAIEASLALAERNGLTTAPAVDFWTEAALFSAAGYDTLVLGSGDIAQAHTADEWVALSELDELRAIYTRLIDDGIQ